MRDSLSRHLPNQPVDPEHMEDMRKAAWHGQGVAVLRPDEIMDPWVRQAVTNEANRRYGKRKEAS